MTLKTIKCLIALLLLFSNLADSLAQNSIRGSIIDQESNETLIGVNIFIPELQKGTVTDIQGYYELNGIPNGHFKVQYSFIGYETELKSIDIYNTSIVIDLKMILNAIEVNEVIITSDRATTQHENAIKIEQVKKSTLDNSTETNLISKLAAVPGIDAVTKGNGIASPVIRGLSTTNIVMLNNGVKMENYQFSVDHPYLVDETDISSIEIIKGPASLLYGSDAMGGVINLIKAPPAPVNSLKGKFQSAYCSNYAGISNRLAISASGENVFGGIAAYQTASKDYKTGDNVVVPNSRNSTYGFSGNTGLRLKKGLLKLSYDYAKMTPGLTIPPSISFIESNQYKNEVWYQNLDNHLITSNNTLFFNRIKFDIDVSYQHNRRKLQGAPSVTLVDMGLNSLTWQIKSKYHLSEQSNFVVAYQGLYQSNHNHDAPNHVLPDYTLTNNSLAALWQYDFNQNTFYQLGLRYDNRFLNIPDQVKSNDEIEISEEFSRSYNNLSFSTGVTHEIINSLLLRGNVASAYRTPSVAELSQDGIHGNRYEQGNWNLNSQRNIEGDLSLHYCTKNIMFELAGFYNRIFDYIFLSPTSDTTLSGLDIYRYEQSNATIYGLECEFEWKPISPFTIQSTYAHVTAIQDNNDPLPFIPQDKLSGKFIYDFSGKGNLDLFEIAVNPLVAFKQNTPQKYETETPSYFILNAYVKAVIKIRSQMLDVGIFAHNILNAAYYDHLSTLKEVGYYNMGRNISIKLGIPFKSGFR